MIVGTTLMTLGYDPRKKRFVGTFVGSMMTNLWIYDGELDKDERVLTLALRSQRRSAVTPRSGQMISR